MAQWIPRCDKRYGGGPGWGGNKYVHISKRLCTFVNVPLYLCVIQVDVGVQEGLYFFMGAAGN